MRLLIFFCIATLVANQSLAIGHGGIDLSDRPEVSGSSEPSSAGNVAADKLIKLTEPGRYTVHSGLQTSNIVVKPGYPAEIWVKSGDTVAHEEPETGAITWFDVR